MPGSVLPKVLVVITGKGAGKAEFEAQVREKEALGGGWDFVRVRTAWLALEDYPKLLGTISNFLFLPRFPLRLGFPFSPGAGRELTVRSPQRLSGFGHLATREHVGGRLTDEGCRHVWVWTSRLRA